MAPSAMAFAGWGHPPPMMYGYPQHPSFFRQPPVPPPTTTRPSQSSKRSKSANPVSAPTPASTEATSPAVSASTPATEAASEGNLPLRGESVRSESVEPKPLQQKKKKAQHPFTQQPLRRAIPKEEKGKEPAMMGSPLDIFTSLATRLNSVDGSTEPPAPDTAEGQLLDCMVAWLKTAAGARISEAIGLPAATPTASSQSADGLTPAGAIEIPGSPAPTTEPASSQSMSSSQLSSQPSTSQQASSSQPTEQPIASSSNASQSKPGRTVLGNRANVGNKQPTKRVVSDGKGSSKSISRSISGPQPGPSNAGKKRGIEEAEHGGPNKAKRQKTGRTVSGSSMDISTNTDSSPSTKGTETVKGKRVIEFPSTSEILGIKFAPRRAYSANLASGSNTILPPKKSIPEPETPKPQKRQSNGSYLMGSIEPTSPFMPGEGADESLFSEAGSPVKNRIFSPYKPMGRRASDVDDLAADAIRPSSPCERRASLGKNKDPKTPVRNPRPPVTRSPSPPDTRTPQPHWAMDLPPSSPPPPSSPIDSTPTELEDEEDPLEGQQQQPPTEEVNVNESPSKIFARYFDLGPQDGGDLATSLLGGASSSFPSSDNELDSDFTFGLEGSSTSYQYNEYNWSDSALMSSLGESSEGEPDGEVNGNGATSDLDFDVGELLGWITQAPGTSSTFQPSNLPAENPASEGATDEERDPLRDLLGGCVV